MPYRITETSPSFTVDVDGMERAVAQYAFDNSIGDAGAWAAFIAVRFNSVNASGTSAGTRALLQDFFTRLVKIEP